MLPAAEAQLEAPWRAVFDPAIDLTAAATGPAPRELSALAWDPQVRELVAVSDRGRLFRYRLATRDGRLHADAVLASPLALSGAPGERKPARPNAEALAWRISPSAAPGLPEPPGELLLASEQGNRVWRLAPDGKAIGHLAWPAPLQAALSAAAGDGTRHGVEAITWHAEHGLLAALQRPRKASADSGRNGAGRTRVHWIHATSGLRWGFVPAGADSQLKAIEARPDGSLLLLERVRQPGDSRLHTVLRWLDPAVCGDQVLCAAPSLPMFPAPIVGHDNVEGLACKADGTCWLVNDGGADAEQPTRLWQFRLVPR